MVGSQPFGGQGLSGTGPKAGGPLYLRRLVESSPLVVFERTDSPSEQDNPLSDILSDWITQHGNATERAATAPTAGIRSMASKQNFRALLGEKNSYTLLPKDQVLCLPSSDLGALLQITCCIASGNSTVLVADKLPVSQLRERVKQLPEAIQEHITIATSLEEALNLSHLS